MVIIVQLVCACASACVCARTRVSALLMIHRSGVDNSGDADGNYSVCKDCDGLWAILLSVFSICSF